MSVSGSTFSPLTCSGAIQPVVPTTSPVRVSDAPSAAEAIPKSMTFSPRGAHSTLAGFRSRCTRPTEWIDSSACASPAANACWRRPSSGPYFATRAREVGAADVLADHVRGLGLRIGVEHLHDAGAGDPAGGRHLTPETSPETVVISQFAAHHLDCHLLARLARRTVRRLGEVHHAHAARHRAVRAAVTGDLLRVIGAQRGEGHGSHSLR